MDKKKKFFNFVKASETRGEIFIYGDIVPEGYDWGEDTTASGFQKELEKFNSMEQIDVRINSGGGDVFTAVAVYNMIKRTKAKTVAHIDGLAASAASVIAMACDDIVMPSNSLLMIHNAWTFAIGNHHELRKSADDLERINESTVKQAYLSRNPELDEAVVAELMDNESWLSAAEAFELGLITSVGASTQVAASLTDEQIARYKNTPAAVVEPEALEPNNDNSERFEAMEAQIAALVAAIENKQVAPAATDPKAPTKQNNWANLFTL